jgi:hypothetical protein
MLRRNRRKLAFLPLLFLLFSCVKDVDLDQIDEVVIPPTAAIDLVFFDLEASDLKDTSSGAKVASDDTRLEFLDDDYIQDGLMRADFIFKFVNTFQQPGTATVKFLSASNSLRHQVVIDIPSGTANSPAVVNITEIVGVEQISRIRNSIKMSVDIEIFPNSEPLEGTLKMESKAYYYFEFK